MIYDKTKIRESSRNARGLPPLTSISKYRTSRPSDPLTLLAQEKYRTNGLTNQLRLLDTPFREKYVSSFLYCSKTVLKSGKQLKRTRCKRPWCETCHRLRTLDLWLGYKDELRGLQDPQFVTLTLPSITTDDPEVLREVIAGSGDEISRILKRLKRTVKGLRKLEIDGDEFYNFHAHYHYLVSGEQTAKALVEAWLKSYPTASRCGQNIKPVYSLSKRFFGYFVKRVTGRTSHIPAMDVIFRATENVRVLQALGLRKQKTARKTVEPAEEEILYKWDISARGYVDHSTGELLTPKPLGEDCSTTMHRNDLPTGATTADIQETPTPPKPTHFQRRSRQRKIKDREPVRIIRRPTNIRTRTEQPATLLLLQARPRLNAHCHGP